MAYTAYDLAGAEALSKTFKKAEEAVKAAGKDKAKAKDALKEHENAGKAAIKYLGEQMKGIEGNYKAHVGKLDAHKKLAKDTLAESKKALEKLRNDPMNQGLADTAGTAAGMCDTCAGLMKTDADEFGKSWFKAREYKASAQFDDKVAADFNKRRLTIINQSKYFIKVLDEIKSMKAEGDTLKAEAQRLRFGGAEDLGEARERAKALLDELTKLHEGMRTANGKRALFNLKNGCKRMADYAKMKGKDVRPGDLDAAKGVHADLMSNLQGNFPIEEQIKSKFETIKSGMSKTELADKEVLAAMKQALGIVKLSAADIKQAETDVKTATANYATFQKNAAAAGVT